MSFGRSRVFCQISLCFALTKCTICAVLTALHRAVVTMFLGAMACVLRAQRQACLYNNQLLTLSSPDQMPRGDLELENFRLQAFMLTAMGSSLSGACDVAKPPHTRLTFLQAVACRERPPFAPTSPPIAAHRAVVAPHAREADPCKAAECSSVERLVYRHFHPRKHAIAAALASLTARFPPTRNNSVVLEALAQ